MKQAGILFGLIFSIITAFTAETDSLENELKKNISDKARIGILQKLCARYIGSDTSLSLQYGLECVEFARSVKDVKGEAHCLNNIGAMYSTHNNYEKALSYHFQSYQLWQSLDTTINMGTCTDNIALCYYYLGHYDKAIEFFRQSLSIYQIIDERLRESLAYNNIGEMLEIKGDHGEAIGYLVHSLNIKQELGEAEGVANTMMTVGRLFLHQGNYDKGLEYFLNAREIFRDINHAGGILTATNRISEAYLKKEDYRSALKAVEEGFSYKDSTNNIYEKAELWHNYGNAASALGQTKQALSYYAKSLEIRESLNDELGMAGLLNNIAGLYLKRGDYQKALTAANRSLRHASAVKAKPELQSAYYTLSLIYEKNSDYKKSYKYYKLYTETKDSLLNEQSMQRIAEVETRYETEHKEKEIALLRKEKEIGALELLNKQTVVQNQQMIILISVLTLLLAGIVVTLLYNRNKIIRQKNEELIKLEEFKQAMTNMIVHDLKNPLNAIIGYTEFDPSKRVNNSIRQAGRQMLNMIANILDVQKFEQAEVRLEKEVNLVEKSVQAALNNLSIIAEKKQLKVDVQIDPALKTAYDFEIITRVFMNLVYNAIKFTPVGGSITINASEQEIDDKPYICIQVADTGIGIPEDKQVHIFDKFYQVESYRPKERDSTGIGLTYCKMAVEAHGGKIWVKSKEGEGSTFYFTLPFNNVAATEHSRSQEHSEVSEK